MSHTTGVVCQEGLRLLLKRPWEPAAYQTADPPVLKTLPYDATLILTPNLPAPANPKMRRLVSKRMSNWRKMWGEVFANVFEIEPPNYSSATGLADVKQVGSLVPLCSGNQGGGSRQVYDFLPIWPPIFYYPCYIICQPSINWSKMKCVISDHTLFPA